MIEGAHHPDEFVALVRLVGLGRTLLQTPLIAGALCQHATTLTVWDPNVSELGASSLDIGRRLEHLQPLPRGYRWFTSNTYPMIRSLRTISVSVDLQQETIGIAEYSVQVLADKHNGPE